MGELDRALSTLDGIHGRYGTDAFPVGARGVPWQDAWDLDAFGFAVLHAHPDLRRESSVTFRAVPALDTPAPYRLVPVISPTAPTVWTGTLTREGLRLVRRVLHPEAQRPVRQAQSGRRTTAVLVPPVAMPMQPSLDGGSWAPEQAQLGELLWSLESARTPALPMPRAGFLGPPPVPYDQLHAPLLTGARIPGWATFDGESLAPATLAVLQYDSQGPSTAGLSAGPHHVTFTVVERRTVAEVVSDFDLPLDIAWRFVRPTRAAGPTARLVSSAIAWDLYVHVNGSVLVCAMETDSRER